MYEYQPRITQVTRYVDLRAGLPRRKNALLITAYVKTVMKADVES